MNMISKSSVIIHKLSNRSLNVSAKQILSPAAKHIIDSKFIDIKLFKGSARHGKVVTKADVLLGLKTGHLAVNTLAPLHHEPEIIKTIPTTLSIPAVTTNTNTAVNVAQTVQQIIHTSSANPISYIAREPLCDDYEDIPNSNIRKVIAKRLTESKATVTHIYSSINCNLDNAIKLRKELKKNYDINISMNDIVIKSAALALKDVPAILNKWNPKTSSIDINSQIDISIAVATPNGLITPIITNPHQRSLNDISLTIKSLANRAKEGKLKPEEYQGGSFSISNLGMFGINSFTAVINPPQSCILAVGAGINQIAPPLANNETNELRIINSAIVQLSADRRVVNEAIIGQFLKVRNLMYSFVYFCVFRM